MSIIMIAMVLIFDNNDVNDVDDDSNVCHDNDNDGNDVDV